MLYVNRFVKHLDRVGGGGDPKLFHSKTFEDVKQFLRFDLEANAAGFNSYVPATRRCLWRHVLCTTGMWVLHWTCTQVLSNSAALCTEYPPHLLAQPVRFRDN